MRMWRAAQAPIRCGNCWRETAAGQPIQVIELKGVDRKRTRCVACAVGPVDWDEIHADQERHAIAADAQPPPYRPMRGFSRVSDNALFDPKLAAAGRDD